MLISGEKKFSLRALLMNVNILAILAGSLLFFLNIRLPEILHNALSSVGDMIGPAAMLIVGMLIADLKPEDLKNCRRIWKPVLFRLVLLPLLLDLAAFCLEEQQNQLIDRLELGGDRAAALSAMNMGVNLVEVVSLFASSVLAAIGVGWCFALCSALLLSGALVLCRSPRVSPAA